MLNWCFPTDICNGDLKFLMNSRNTRKKNPTSKYLSSWNLRLKLDLAIIFWAILLMINFEDLMLIFYIWVPNTTIECAMKTKSNLNNSLLLLLGVWPKNYGFSVLEHFSIYLAVLAHHKFNIFSTRHLKGSFGCYPSHWKAEEKSNPSNEMKVHS